MHAKLLGATLAAVAVIALAAAPVEAQWRDGWGSSGGYDAGYRDGARAGRDDARDGRGFEYQRHRDYRSADGGYRSRDRRRDANADQYRAGFVAGYRDAFYTGGGRGAGVGRRPPVPRYGNTFPGNGRGRFPGVSDDIGFSNGFEEGYKRGLDDGRDRDRFDPRRHGRYRDADQGYRREYGPKRIYEGSYRRGFERGYDEGYAAAGQRRRW
jgi:hypothetical protein